MSNPKEAASDPVLHRKIAEFLEEDLGFGDITTDAVVNPDIYAEAQIICREDAVVSGVEEAVLTFNLLGCSAESLVKEGEQVEVGRSVLRVSGGARAVLKGERTALNILGRMSGVATETRRMVDETVKSNSNIRVAATRKTLPGFRIFDKKAVQTGGGDAHRFRLDDAVLIKDNHLAIAGSISSAVEAARRRVSLTKKIEVEVTSLAEAQEAVAAGADIVMFDNMSPGEIRRVVEALKKKGVRDKVILEASGGIGFENIRRYSGTGVDVISLGYLTHSVKSIDFTLEITGKKKR